ncbi:MAG TPA: selenoneine synthase SenA [Albitalea sp.]|nr:selenoneine synthase SenA [Albitalea sp.]
MADARRLHGDALAAALRDSRRRTLSLVNDLDDLQWQVPQQDGVNPLAWELAHLAWFAEFWVLRRPHHVGGDGFVHAALPARLAGPDAHFDSSRLAHAERWSTPLPSRRQVMAMLDAQLHACLRAMPAGDDDAALYFHRLALFHEDMHGEALVWLRASLEHPAPDGAALPCRPAGAPLSVPGAQVQLGWPAGRRGFAFDNELPGGSVALPPFEVDAQPISAGAFQRFVDAGGYDTPAFWPGEAGRWRAAQSRRHPLRWRRSGAAWQLRWFDRWLPLDPDLPLVHVNAFEAEAYCAWAGRRLPSAAQWEHAATAAHGFRFGDSVWEWTADAFQPFAGFVPGPYRDYSAPWFGSHRELRGGAFATHPRLRDARYRNFFMPSRADVFSGFRTVSRGA